MERNTSILIYSTNTVDGTVHGDLICLAVSKKMTSKQAESKAAALRKDFPGYIIRID